MSCDLDNPAYLGTLLRAYKPPPVAVPLLSDMEGRYRPGSPSVSTTTSSPK